MSYYDLGCIGSCDFEHMADFAIKRFVHGYATMDLMQHASSEKERAEIALVCLLDIDDENIVELDPCCEPTDICASINCREKLRLIVEEELVKRQ